MAKKVFVVLFALTALVCLAAIAILAYGVGETAGHATSAHPTSEWLKTLDWWLWVASGVGFVALLVCSQFLPEHWL